MRVTSLFFFWIMVFALPALMFKFALSLYCESAIAQNILRDSETLKLESENFQFDLKIENLLLTAIAEVKKNLINSCNLQDPGFSTASLSRLIHSRFLEKHRLSPMFCAAYDTRTGHAAGFNPTGTGINPGRRSLEIMMSQLARPQTDQPETAKKRYQQIVSSVFGGFIELPDRPGMITSGFMIRNGSDRVFVCWENLPDAEGKAVVTIFTVFSENAIGLRHMLNYARNRRTFPGTARHYAFLRTLPDRDYVVNNRGRIFFAAPINPSALRIGSHVGKSWYNLAIRSGTARQKPSFLPFTVVSIDSGRAAVPLVRYLPIINMALVIFLFAGIAIIRQAMAGSFTASRLSRRFRTAMLAATVLPFAIFIGTAHEFSRHFSNAMLASHMQNITSDVRILEMNILNNDLRERQTTSHFISLLNQNRMKSEAELTELLESQIGKLYEGYAMLRSDGFYIEKLPDRSIAAPTDYNKLVVVKDINFAQYYNVFSLASALKPDFARRMEKHPCFIQWKAYSVHFNDIDRDAFCQQDGSYYLTRNAQKSYFRISIHNLFPEKDKSELWAGLMIMKNARSTVENFLKSRSNDSGFALKKLGDMTVHSAVFRYHDESVRELDHSFAWPENALKDPEMVAATHSLHDQKKEASWVHYDRHGMATLFSVKALSDLPFIIVSKGIITSNALQNRLLQVFILCLILYSLLLVAVLSKILADFFLKPLNLLLNGVELLERGQYPLLHYSSTDELGELVEQFNSMAEGMRQRQLLERFISDELSQTITREASAMEETGGALVYRTIMFIHIRNFAELCEQISAEQAILLLNSYFSALEPEIRRFNGQIDKYIGDAIMVSFSRERTGNCPEQAAARAALACREALPKLIAGLINNGLPEILTGTGIACGMVIAGKIGARKSRKDYTMIGDPVNLAARLEACSHFSDRSHILIDSNVSGALGSSFAQSYFNEITVKGKSIPVKVFELAGIKNDNC